MATPLDGTGSLRVDPQKLAAIRARYEGKGLGQADGPSMVVEAIAVAFGVHPNSIHFWQTRDCWRRPSWYLAKRPTRYKRGHTRLGDLAARILAILARAAGAGAPCPGNLLIAHECACNTQSLRQRLRAMEAEGLFRRERVGSRRRVILPDGRATAWTEHGVDALSAERRSASRAELVLRAVRRAADAGQACPGTDALAALARCSRPRARRIFAALEEAGRFRCERRPKARRVIFPDGAATAWPGTRGRGPAIDYAVRDAERLLRQEGVLVWDLGVHRGYGWGVAWCVDGRTRDRAGLLAMAAARRVRALQRLREAA